MGPLSLALLTRRMRAFEIDELADLYPPVSGAKELHQYRREGFHRHVVGLTFQRLPLGARYRLSHGARGAAQFNGAFLTPCHERGERDGSRTLPRQREIPQHRGIVRQRVRKPP